MQLSSFLAEFKHRGGVFLTPSIILFRKPLEVYDYAQDKVLARGNKKNHWDNSILDAVIIAGHTVGDIIAAMDHIPEPVDLGGRGGGSGSYSEAWPSAGGGAGKTIADHPARMNVKVNIQRSYEDMLKAFADTHAASPEEHGVVVDEYGFATKYLHGDASSISGLTGTSTQMALHNHPAGGWPTFSKEDILNTAAGSRKGIVAVSSKQGRGPESAKYAGIYTFQKSHNFNANGFIKAVRNAQIRGKDYNDAVTKWLRANQKRYGYKFSFTPAK